MDKPPPYNENYTGYPGYGQPTAPTSPGFAPMPQPGTVPPVVFQPSVTTISVTPQFGDQPTTTVCPNCHQQVATKIVYEAGTFTYLCAIGLALFVWCGCCLIPCCCDSCKDVHHYCPNCNTQLGIHKRL